MTISNRVIQLAKERALFGVRVTAQEVLRAAGAEASQRMRTARSPDEEREFREAYQFTLHQGKVFQQRMEAAYRDLLDRAMQTMYTDLRTPLGRVSADNLTLIDDDTVNRQIRIDHVVKRLRDADDEHLQRVNLIIGRMHGKDDAKERENPFRPYLLARALHQVVTDMVGDWRASQRLFDLLAEELARQLPEFYRSIRDVFEAHGLRADLVARKSLHYRSRLAGNGNGNGLPEQVARDLDTRVIPGLQRALEAMNTADTTGAAGAAGTTGTARPLELEGFVNGIFDAGADSARGQASPLRAGSQALVSRLGQFQQLAARGEPVGMGLAPAQNQLFALNEQIGPDETTRLERVAIDVVAVLFDLILADGQIADRFRAQIGRLQIPFLKAAMLMPEMLQQPAHPARQLVNRMGSAAAGLDPDSPLGTRVECEITRIVTRILVEFRDDLGIFAACLAEFDQFLAEHFSRADPEAALGVVALEDVEEGAGNAAAGEPRPDVPAWLTDFSIDPRVVDFIANTWVRVLERERTLPPDPAGGRPAGGFHDVLPDLIWSVQDKQSPQDRAELVRMLPGLVKRLQAGLSLLGLSKEDMRRELDQLVDVHTQVLRAGLAAPNPQAPALPALRERFGQLNAGQLNAGHLKGDIGGASAAPIEAGRLHTELAKRGVAVELDLERDQEHGGGPGPATASEADADWLEGIRPGTSLERWSDDGFRTGWLVWISKRRTLYLIKLKDQGMPVVYSKTSLVKALREGSLRLLEQAPVFERAVEGLLFGVRSADGRGR